MIFNDDIKAVLNSMHEGILIVDSDSRIVFGNEAYLRFISSDSNIHPSQVRGKKLRDLRPGAMLPEVVRTGVPMLRQRRREAEDFYYVNMYPVFSGNQIIGGLSVVTFMDDAAAFREELKAMEERNSQVMSRMGAFSARDTFSNIIAKGKKSAACKASAMRLAETEFPILMTSENGAGMSMYAQAIHNASPRHEGPYIKVNCQEMKDGIDTELFGVEGIRNSIGNIGLLEAAKGGTLFIDEITDMPPDVQAKLYNTLQTKSFYRIGADYLIPLETRVIVGSNTDIERRVADNRFNAELYYLFRTFSFNIPALRERMDDLPLIVRQELARLETVRKKKFDITNDAIDRLMHHTWPGNVRELQHVIELSSYLAKDGMITVDILPEYIGQDISENEKTLPERVRAFEKNEILKMMEFYGSDLQAKKLIAEKLGISLASLYAKLK